LLFRYSEHSDSLGSGHAKRLMGWVGLYHVSQERIIPKPLYFISYNLTIDGLNRGLPLHFSSYD